MIGLDPAKAEGIDDALALLQVLGMMICTLHLSAAYFVYDYHHGMVTFWQLVAFLGAPWTLFANIFIYSGGSYITLAVILTLASSSFCTAVHATQ
jgi:hypothetical protein